MRFKYYGTDIKVFIRVRFSDLRGCIFFYRNLSLIYQFIDEDFQVKIKANPWQKLKIGIQLYTGWFILRATR